MTRAILWLVFVSAAAVAIVTVAIPTLYIQPFKPQQAEGLARAYTMRQAAPAVTAICLPIVVLSAAAILWGFGRSTKSFPPENQQGPRDQRGQAPRAVRRRWMRLALASARAIAILGLVALTSLVTWFCRQNHFEWMFAPPAEVRYVSAKEAAKFLTNDEMVMGIEVNGLSLAYPIRQMAYHHVVNDMFGTTPVVVTY